MCINEQPLYPPSFIFGYIKRLDLKLLFAKQNKLHVLVVVNCLHSANLTSLPIGFHIWLWRYTCLMFVVNLDALAQASDFRIERRRVVFLCWMQNSKLGSLRHQFASRLNAHSQTDWAIEDQAKNLNSTGRSNDERSFIPLDFTADWLSHLALAIYMVDVCCS